MQSKLVKFADRGDGLVSIRYITERGEKCCFYAMKKELFQPVCTDCGNFLQIIKHGAQVTFGFTWLSTTYLADGSERVSGHKDSFKISEDVFSRVLDLGEGESLAVLCHDSPTHPHLNFEKAQDVLKIVAKDKVRRRCLTKALRDNFKWMSSKEICFYPDYHLGDFFFVEQTAEGPGISGGLIFEQGDHPKYAVHT